MSVLSKLLCWQFARGDKKRDAGLATPAGGHLLALYCIACTDENYAAHYDFEIPSQLLPKAVALNCGLYEVSREGAQGKLVKDLMPHKGTEEEIRLITPFYHLNSSFPLAFVMTAVKDFLREDSIKMHSLLDDLGVSNEFHLYDDKDHSLSHVFHVNIRLEDAKKCNDEECDFFRKKQEPDKPESEGVNHEKNR